MKPPRIYIRYSKFYAEIYDPTTKRQRKVASGIEADIPEPATRDDSWWRKSRHAHRIRKFLANLEAERAQAIVENVPLRAPRRTQMPPMDAIMAGFNHDSERRRDRPLAEKSLEHRRLAVQFLLRFKPDFTFDDLTDDFVFQLRKWGKEQLAPTSLKGYWIELRSLAKYAERMGYIDHNYFRDYTIAVPHRSPKRISVPDLKKVLAFIYHKNRDLFDQVWCELLLGVRVTNTTDLTPDVIDFEERVLRYRNTKGRGRFEVLPVSEAFLMNIRMMESHGKYLFKYRNRKTVYEYLVRACKMVGVDRIGPHDLKRAYLQEIAQAKPDARTMDLLAHHAPSVNQTVANYYAGADIELMREVIDKAQAHWIADLQSWIDTPDDGIPVKFSNPKGNAGRRDRQKIDEPGDSHGTR